jgi:hypothetical protein
MHCQSSSLLESWQYPKTEAQELISEPCLGTKARFLSFNRTQSRVVNGLLTRRNTLRRHLYLMGLSISPLCRRCGAEGETSAHILCECEALASLRHVYLGSFFLEPEDIKSVNLGAIWNSGKVIWLPLIEKGHKGPVILRPRCIRAAKPQTQLQINQSVNQSINLSIYLSINLVACSCPCLYQWTCVFCLSFSLHSLPLWVSLSLSQHSMFLSVLTERCCTV